MTEHNNEYPGWGHLSRNGRQRWPNAEVPGPGTTRSGWQEAGGRACQRPSPMRGYRAPWGGQGLKLLGWVIVASAILFSVIGPTNAFAEEACWKNGRGICQTDSQCSSGYCKVADEDDEEGAEDEGAVDGGDDEGAEDEDAADGGDDEGAAKDEGAAEDEDAAEDGSTAEDEGAAEEAPKAAPKAAPKQACLNNGRGCGGDSACCSGYCDEYGACNERPTKPPKAEGCTVNGRVCETNDECCGHVCSGGFCKGPRTGEACTPNQRCESFDDQCINGKCQSSCPKEGDACTTNCCDGLFCEMTKGGDYRKGYCKPIRDCPGVCKTNADCCGAQRCESDPNDPLGKSKCQ